MARVEVHEDRIIVRLTKAEKLASFHRGDLTLDRTAITSAVITDNPWSWLHGVRSPGSNIPGKYAAGTWRNLTGRDFVLLRSGRDAVVIDFERPSEPDEQPGWVGEFDQYSRVILSTTHAAELVRALRLDPGADRSLDAG